MIASQKSWQIFTEVAMAFPKVVAVNLYVFSDPSLQSATATPLILESKQVA